MKYLICLISIFSCNTNRYKENVRDTLYVEQPIYFDSVTKDDSILIISFNGTKVIFYDTIPKKDSTHYFFTQYIKFKNRGIKDSLNPYYFKLLKK